MARKYKLLSLVIIIAAFYGLLLKAALSFPLPSPKEPLILYSNQTRDDLRQALKKSFTIATRSIDIWMYAATDALLLSHLKKRADQNIAVSLYYDKKGGTTPLPLPIFSIPVKCKGLMHRKITLIDDEIVFIGSANLTTSSLEHHDNLSLGLYDPPLAQFLKKPTQKTYTFNHGLVWLLPDPTALHAIIQRIDAAKHSIFVAMFTLTQLDLIEALIRAHQRGVHVTVAIDRYTARGASKKALQKLSTTQITLYQSASLPLLHHKWAFIDETSLILGSTNWTASAFSKNQDILVFLDRLPRNIQTKMHKLTSAIRKESQKLTNE